MDKIRIQAKVERKIYKMLCMIIKDFYFQNKMNLFYDLIAKLYYLKSKKNDLWLLWPMLKKSDQYSLILRNQFAVLSKIVNSEVEYQEFVSETKLIANRYKKSSSLRKKIYKDD